MTPNLLDAEIVHATFTYYLLWLVIPPLMLTVCGGLAWRLTRMADTATIDTVWDPERCEMFAFTLAFLVLVGGIVYVFAFPSLLTGVLYPHATAYLQVTGRP